MAVCVPAVPSIANHCIKEELNPNTFSLRHFHLAETQTAAADTALTTQAEIHQYSNDDTPEHSADTEEGQDHHYASAAPPPLPVCDDEDNPSPRATGPDPLQAAPGQPASHIDETESDEEERAVRNGSGKFSV
ncbi:hypothetical protein Bbelb_011420 [Branchiostoma belcheri]|nr:hypothetical protein Bbelb_011420 [Branchiostoma belcheri]